MMSSICSLDFSIRRIALTASLTEFPPSVAISEVSSACCFDSTALLEITWMEFVSSSMEAVISSTVAACVWAPSLRFALLEAMTFDPSAN